MPPILPTERTPPGHAGAHIAVLPMWAGAISAARFARLLAGGSEGMPAGRRRRVDALLLALAVLLVGVAAAVGVVVADTERIAGMWVGAEISSDGSARITEVIDYDFGRERRHGIFRDVLGLLPTPR
jgi:hypothetical protein